MDEKEALAQAQAEWEWEQGQGQASTPTFLSEAKGVFGQAVRGIGDMGKLASYVTSPISGGMERAAWESGVEQNLPEKPQTTLGKLFGGVAYAAPSAVIPGGGIASGVKSAVAAGLGMGAVDAAGGGEGAQAVGGLLGALTPSGAGRLASGLKNAANAFERWGLGIGKAELNQSWNKLPKIVKREARLEGERPLIESLEGAKKRGLLKGGKSAEDIASRNQAEINRLEGQNEELIGLSDNLGVNVVKPDFANTKAYLNAQGPSGDLPQQFARRLANFEENWDGTLSGLQAWKRGLYGGAYRSATDNAILDRIIANDVKNAIEKTVAKRWGGKVGEEFIERNRLIGENLDLVPALDKAQNAATHPLVDLTKRATGIVSNPIVAAGYSLATGNVLPMLAAAPLWAASTRPGRFAASKALGAGGDIAGLFAGQGKGGAVPMLASLFGQPDKTPAPEAAPTSVVKPEPQAPAAPTTAAAPITKDAVIDALMPRMIQQESGGNPKAVSPKGAMGLVQIMPKTWEEWAPKVIGKGADPKNPVHNEKVARAYMSWLLDRFDGDIPLAVAAYNHGVRNVKELAAGGKTIRDIYARLPKETQNYVIKILGSSAVA